jgi:hypothetical protein
MKLTTDFIPVDCTDLEVGGVSGLLYLLDYEDYLRATVTTGTNAEISGIVLTTTGAKATEYALPRGATIATSPLTLTK